MATKSPPAQPAPAPVPVAAHKEAAAPPPTQQASAPLPPANRTPPAAPAPAPANATDDDVRAAAYRKWEESGRPDGDGVEFWLQAERELRHAFQD